MIDNMILQEKDVRYLLCPAGVCVAHLKKFVRYKFDIPEKYKVLIYHLRNQSLEYYNSCSF